MYRNKELTDMGFWAVDDEGVAVEGLSDLIKFFITKPNEKIKTSLLRAAPIVSFDRWVNSEYIEKSFSSVESAIDWIIDCRDELYFEMLKCLSVEYLAD